MKCKSGFWRVNKARASRQSRVKTFGIARGRERERGGMTTHFRSNGRPIRRRKFRGWHARNQNDCTPTAEINCQSQFHPQGTCKAHPPLLLRAHLASIIIATMYIQIGFCFAFRIYRYHIVILTLTVIVAKSSDSHHDYYQYSLLHCHQDYHSILGL